MSIAVIVLERNIQTFLNTLKNETSEEIVVYPEIDHPEEVEVAIVWRQPPGYISKFSNLRLIYSFGAGVDHILADPGYDPAIPVTRIVDDELTMSMTRYVVAAVSMFQFGFPFHFAPVMKATYHKKRVYPPDLTIGILGLGNLGKASAKALKVLGYRVSGLTRNRKDYDGMTTFVEKEMDEFLEQTNILICMLPLTEKTKDIIDSKVLSKLKKPAFFINVGRGQQVDEEDLIDCIVNGALTGACLDVVKNEPIANDNPLLNYPQIILTPHIASVTNQKNAAIQIGENIRRLKSGGKLINTISSEEGY